jgi:outer membrane protein assembly factor BamA
VWSTDSDYDTNESSAEGYGSSKFILKSIFKDMAYGTGIGLRYDMDFLVLRLDWGVALHLPYDTGRSGFYNIERFKGSHTLHFAVGYPF